MTLSPRILLIDTEDVTRGVTKVNLRGRLDATGVLAIETVFAKLAGARSDLIIDLSRVSFIASTGLRVLIAAFRAVAARDGRMVFLQPEPSVESVLIGSGVDRLIPICRDLPDAIQTVSLGQADDDARPDKPLVFSLRVDRSMGAVRRVGAWVDELAILLNLSSRAEYALRLCLEEAVTNIITHAAAPSADADTIALRLAAEPKSLSLTIQDRCAAYNPLFADPAAAPGDGTHGEGGLGIGLLRQHAREVSWSRVGDINRLAMTIAR